MARLQADLPFGIRVATVSGRYYAMDRDHPLGPGGARLPRHRPRNRAPAFADAASVIDDAYGKGVTDEFIVPASVGGYAGMRDGDAILCFNFRADRIREILAPFLDPAFAGFPLPPPHRLGWCRRHDALQRRAGALTCRPLFPPQTMERMLGQVVSAAGLRQLRMAETEKYPHVTYFLNGGREEALATPARTRVMVPSPKVATYDHAAGDVGAGARPTARWQAIQSGGAFDLIVLNFANPDMVGHTGNVLEAAVRAVEAVDAGLGRIVGGDGAKRAALWW